jgi:hypothetical protein
LPSQGSICSEAAIKLTRVRGAQHNDGALYLLVTDQGYLREPHVVWERLSGIDGDTAFCKVPDHVPTTTPSQLRSGRDVPSV